jgi:hypothetical protein
MLLLDRPTLIVLLLGLSGCASRQYADSTLLSQRPASSVYSIRPVAAAWQQSSILRVIAPDTYLVQLGEGLGDDTVSLFGVKSVASLEPLNARQQTLDIVMPGQKISIEAVSRSENGRLFVLIKKGEKNEDYPSLALTLVQRGLVLPSIACRKIDACTPAVLSVLGAEAIAQACETYWSAKKGRAAAIDLASAAAGSDLGLNATHTWVGDVVSHHFVPYKERDRIPVCRRVHFSDPLMTALSVEQLGFKPMPPASSK